MMWVHNAGDVARACICTVFLYCYGGDSEGVAKPSSYSLQREYLLVYPLPEVIVANFVRSLYSQNYSQRGLNQSPCFCSMQPHRLNICVNLTDFSGFADHPVYGMIAKEW